MDDELGRARDPTTPPDELRALARREASRDVREAVAANPNAPADLLIALAAEHPRAFLSNPVLPLLELEQPDLFRSFHDPAAEALLRYEPAEEIVRQLAERQYLTDSMIGALLTCRSTPEDVLARLPRRTHEHWRALASHPRAYGGALRNCAEYEDAATRSLAAANPRTPPEALARLVRAGASADLSACVAAGDEATEDDLLILSNGLAFAQELAARHPRSPPEALRNLVISPVQARLGLLTNPGITPDLLDQLALHREREEPPRPTGKFDEVDPERPWDADEARFRCALAAHPQLLRSTLDRLANDHASAVRAAAALHPALSKRALTSLGLDNHPDVVHAALGNPALAPEVLAFVVHHRPPARLALRAVHHPAILRSSLEALGQHPDAAVRAAAQASLAGGATAQPPRPAQAPEPPASGGPWAWLRARLRR